MIQEKITKNIHIMCDAGDSIMLEQAAAGYLRSFGLCALSAFKMKICTILIRTVSLRWL